MQEVKNPGIRMLSVGGECGPGMADERQLQSQTLGELCGNRADPHTLITPWLGTVHTLFVNDVYPSCESLIP